MKKWTAFLLALALCGSLAACGGGNNAQADSTEAVSYTHLDVYKRQAPD